MSKCQLICRTVCFQQFDSELAGKQQSFDQCLRLCADILSRAHPDARSMLRHWRTTIESRWSEVKNLAEQKSKKLKDSLESARAVSRQLDSLTDWLKHMETFLSTQNTQLIPENLPIVEQLLQTHVVCIFSHQIISAYQFSFIVFPLLILCMVPYVIFIWINLTQFPK